MQDIVIDLQGLTKHYGKIKAVNNLNLQIRRGEVFGLLGPNGAGKTTTILMMLGLSEPTAGKATICGIDATSQPIEVKQRVGYMPDTLGFYDNMTAIENLIFIARLNGLSDEIIHDRAAGIMELVGLSSAMDRKASTFSRGMKQRLGLAEVLIRDPEIIILDEPTLGIDPSGIREFLQLIRQLSREHGLTVLLSSHHLHQVQQVCDQVGIFVEGKMLVEGDIQSLASKLFEQESTVINVQIAQQWDDQSNEGLSNFKQDLHALPSFKRVEFVGNTAVISLSEDHTSEIVRRLVQHGLDVTGVSRQSYGLDEIYQRYFENNKINNLQDGTSNSFSRKQLFSARRRIFAKGK